MSTNEITAKIRQIKELQQLIEEAEAEMETLKDSIKAEMTAREVDELTADVFKVRWTTVESSRFDSTAFKKAMPELFKQFSKQTTSRRFSIG
jgi:predicted phage-related endonuclease